MVSGSGRCADRGHDTWSPSADAGPLWSWHRQLTVRATYAATAGYDDTASARTTRIMWGILCLVASFLLAAAAVGVAVIWR